MQPTDYPIHPAANLLPMMSDAEYQALKDDISVNGQREDIVTLNGQCLDGRNRLRACQELGITPRTVAADPKAVRDPVAFVYSKAIHRNMTETQKACAAIAFNSTIESMPDSQYTALRKFVKRELGSHLTDVTGLLFGVSGRYIRLAQEIKAADPVLFDDCFTGKTVLTKARATLRRRQKALATTNQQLATSSPTPDDISILRGDSLVEMGIHATAWEIDSTTLPRPSLVIADPDIPTGDFNDFLDFSNDWIRKAVDCLAPTGALVIIARDEYVHEIAIALKDAGLTIINNITWDEQFGNTPGRWSRTTRPILYAARHKTNRTFNSEAALAVSDRMRIYNDTRAAEDTKTMSQCWTDKEVKHLDSRDPERLPGQPDQLPEALINRLILTLSNPGDLVLDPFTGAGTVPAVCLKTGRKCLAFEIDEPRANAARQRVAAIAESQHRDHRDPVEESFAADLTPAA